MAQNRQQGQRKPKKEKRVVSAPVHKRHTIDMTRDRKAELVATEIRKAERKLAKRGGDKLRDHIANLKVMHKRLKTGIPAEVRTRADYVRRQRERGPAATPRKAMAAPATISVATVPPPASASEVPTVS